MPFTHRGCSFVPFLEKRDYIIPYKSNKTYTRCANIRNPIAGSASRTLLMCNYIQSWNQTPPDNTYTVFLCRHQYIYSIIVIIVRFCYMRRYLSRSAPVVYITTTNKKKQASYGSHDIFFLGFTIFEDLVDGRLKIK